MVNNSTNINKTKESLNSDGQQFHQYQQNKRNFKQWWSTIPPISTKQTTTSHLKSMNIKKRTYDFGNPGPDLGQAEKSGRLMGYQPSPYWKLDLQWQHKQMIKKPDKDMLPLKNKAIDV